MNMRWSPKLWRYWVGAGPNGSKTIVAFSISHYVCIAIKIWIDRRRVMIIFMRIAPCCIGLPNLHIDVWTWLVMDIDDLTDDINNLTQWLVTPGQLRHIFATVSWLIYRIIRTKKLIRRRNWPINNIYFIFFNSFGHCPF